MFTFGADRSAIIDLERSDARKTWSVGWGRYSNPSPRQPTNTAAHQSSLASSIRTPRTVRSLRTLTRLLRPGSQVPCGPPGDEPGYKGVGARGAISADAARRKKPERIKLNVLQPYWYANSAPYSPSFKTSSSLICRFSVVCVFNGPRREIQTSNRTSTLPNAYQCSATAFTRKLHI